MRYVILTAAFMLATASAAGGEIRFHAQQPAVASAERESARPCVSPRYEVTETYSFLAASHTHFTICYVPELSEDVPLVRQYARRALRVGREKYGVSRLQYEGKPLHTVFFLFPDERGTVTIGRAFNSCCQEDDRGKIVTEIHMMAPSATWNTGGLCSPNPRDYMSGLVVHEMMHTIHYVLFPDWREKWSAEVSQVWEGLAEYDRLHYSTEWQRTVGVNNLFEKVHHEHRNDVYLIGGSLGSPRWRLGTSRIYWGNSTIMHFYPERRHKDFLERGRLPTANSAVWERFSEWFDSRPEIQGPRTYCR